MTVETIELNASVSCEAQGVIEEDHHWLHVARWIIEANGGAPDPRDINPLISKVERHLGSDIWKVLIACK